MVDTYLIHGKIIRKLYNRQEKIIIRQFYLYLGANEQ